jgi:hypothetical protein
MQDTTTTARARLVEALATLRKALASRGGQLPRPINHMPRFPLDFDWATVPEDFQWPGTNWSKHPEAVAVENARGAVLEALQNGKGVLFDESLAPRALLSEIHQFAIGDVGDDLDSLPARPSILRKMDTMIEDLGGPKPKRVAAGAPKDQGDSGDPNVRHSDDFRSVVWSGTPYTFTRNQAACVKVLWEAWKAGTPELDGLTVVTQADVSQTRLIDVFRSKGKAHVAWGTMIMQGQSKGAYRLSDCRRLPRET